MGMAKGLIGSGVMDYSYTEKGWIFSVWRWCRAGEIQRIKRSWYSGKIYFCKNKGYEAKFGSLDYVPLVGMEN